MQIIELDLISLKLKLKEGSPVIFPTDTVPALGSLPEFSRQLWNIKERSIKKPLILMASKQEELFDLISPNALDDAYEIAKKFWPGPLTLILPVISKVANDLNSGSSTLGMRVPGCDIAQKLLAKTGPLATTSANKSGQPPITNPNKLLNDFPSVPLLAPLPWPDFSCLPSTVLKWQENANWELLREGEISFSAILRK